MVQPRARSVAFALSAFVATASCGPRLDGGNLAGKAAILDAANMALTREDCSRAVELVEGLYNSENTDNEVRAVRSAAYACSAGLSNFFSIVGQFPNERFDAVAGSGSYFWRTASKLFYSSDTTLLDSRISSVMNAIDANMAEIKPGYYVATANGFNLDTWNAGSVLATDRTDDANFYLIFLSMAAIGALQNRYSAPSTTNYTKTHVLGYTASQPSGWAVATNTEGDGCLYAASVLNLVDAAIAVEPYLKGSVLTAVQSIKAFKSYMDQACEAGCTGAVATGCALTAGTCATCPKTLRNYASCTGLATDKNSCAAAGIATLINTSNVIGWFP